MMKIKIGFLTVCTLLAWFLSDPLYGIASLAAAALHELGHIGMAKLLGVPFRMLYITPFGAALTPDSFMGTYEDEVMIAAAGPLTNLFCVLLVLPLDHLPFFFIFLLSSLFFAILNLFPVSGFDGGRILSCLLSRRLSPSFAEYTLKITSFVTVFCLWSFSVYILLRVGSSLSLFVFSCSLFLKLFVKDGKSV